MLVDDEAAVGITVERQTDIGTGGCDVALKIDQVRRFQRIGFVVRKCSVEFEIQGQQSHAGDCADNRGRGVSGHAVARVDGHPQGAQSADVDQRPKKIRIIREHVPIVDVSTRTVVGRDAGDDVVANSRKTGVLAHRLGLCPTQFDAVIGRRVVACSEHRAGTIQQTGCEVQLIGGGQSDPHNVEALADHTLREGCGQRRRARPHIVTDRDPQLGVIAVAFVAQHSGERRTHIGDESLVKFHADQATDVIGLDHTAHLSGGPGHGGTPGAMGLECPVSLAARPPRTIAHDLRWVAR